MDINTFSPSFRDSLLNRNIVAKSITTNGLSGYLQGIGYPAGVHGLSPNVIDSPDLTATGDGHRDTQINLNRYKGLPMMYSQAFTYLNTTFNSTVTNEPYGNESNLLDDSKLYRELNYNVNEYVADETLYNTINLNTIQVHSNPKPQYLDANGTLNLGGPSTQPIDIIGTVLNGQGVGISSSGPVTSFDIRSSLAGRVLGGTGLIKDSALGIIGAKQLALALANNAAFGLQQETLGSINLNPLSLITGKGLISPNYDITVPTSNGGKVADFMARVMGFESPISLLGDGASIFASENNIGNIERANNIIANTGKGQVLALFSNILANTTRHDLHIRYRPGFKDSRTGKGFNKTNPISAQLYAADSGDGIVKDFLNPIDDLGQPTLMSESNKNPSVLNSEFDDLLYKVRDDKFLKSFVWSDKNNNKEPRDFDAVNGTEFKNPKSILYKTQQLFKSGYIKTLTSGHGVKNQTDDETQTTSRGFMSKGSGVLSQEALENSINEASEIFCRTFTPISRYDEVQRLQKSRGLYDEGFAYRNGSSDNSVLDDNGFVRIAPYRHEPEVKKYMFSIENLAWSDSDSLANLPESEKGPGDEEGKQGRIMWFPPYDISFSENNSVSLDSNNFIGRGEPIYTYNNTERTGTLSFKIIVDHPSYMNAMKDMSDSEVNDDYLASFFAGCTPMDSKISERLTSSEKQSLISNNITKSDKKAIEKEEAPEPFFIYFANDNNEILPNYENGDNIPSGSIPVSNPLDPKRCGIEKYSSTNTTSWEDTEDIGLNKNGISDPNFIAKYKKHLKEICPHCEIHIAGYASSQGNKKANECLALDRAINTGEWIKANLLEADDKLLDVRIKLPKKGEEKTNTGSSGESVSIKKAKEARAVMVTFTYNPNLNTELNKQTPIVKDEKKINVSSKIKNRFYDESMYFQKLSQEDKFAFDKIKSKIKFFHPSFHSITPEGLNSRLTFLLQCTRQGTTNSNLKKPDNLAFGTPPVCILRIGDFYHSKVIMDNLNITYDPLVWDLNPEGIGVQPMIANVDISFKFIGGQSLHGPINKLQNAVSFNFFANTHVYDPRADKLVRKDTTSKPVLEPGVKSVNEAVITSTDSNGLPVDSINPIVEVDQVGVANEQNNEEDTSSNLSDIERIKIGIINVEDTNLKFSIVRKKVSDTNNLTKTSGYSFKATILDLTGNEFYQFGPFKLNATDEIQEYTLDYAKSSVPLTKPLDISVGYTLKVEFSPDKKLLKKIF